MHFFLPLFASYIIEKNKPVTDCLNKWETNVYAELDKNSASIKNVADRLEKTENDVVELRNNFNKMSDDINNNIEGAKKDSLKTKETIATKLTAHEINLIEKIQTNHATIQGKIGETKEFFLVRQNESLLQWREFKKIIDNREKAMNEKFDRLESAVSNDFVRNDFAKNQTIFAGLRKLATKKQIKNSETPENILFEMNRINEELSCLMGNAGNQKNKKRNDFFFQKNLQLNSQAED